MKKTKIALLVVLLQLVTAYGQISNDSVCFSVKEANRIDFKFKYYQSEIKSLETAVYEKVAESAGIVRLKNEWKQRAVKCESTLTSCNELLKQQRTQYNAQTDKINAQSKQIQSLKHARIKIFIRGVGVGIGVSGIVVGTIYVVRGIK